MPNESAGTVLGQVWELLGFKGELSAAQRALLPRWHACFVGFGAVGGPLAEQMAEYGLRQATLIDPKPYVAKSVDSQCSPEEVGLWKVEAGRRRLAGRGLRVTPYVHDVYAVVDGVVRANSFVIVSADNRRADIGANRLAWRMGAMLLKVNVEPLFNVVSVRAYDFRKPSPLCAECQMSELQYVTQRHPKSCDGTGERSTGSPRHLSQVAGAAGTIAALEILEESKAARWLGSELQIRLDDATTPRLTWSKLSPNANCRWDHAERWPALQRLSSGPEKISLAELARYTDVLGWQPTKARFCQRVALRRRCEGCGHLVEAPYWLSEIDQVSGACPLCAGRLAAVPFYAYRELPLSALSSVIERRLADWGVASAAVIELSGEAGRQAFVVGKDGSAAEAIQPDEATQPVEAIS
jgi:hypothetical protein